MLLVKLLYFLHPLRICDEWRKTPSVLTKSGMFIPVDIVWRHMFDTMTPAFLLGPLYDINANYSLSGRLGPGEEGVLTI